MLGVIAAVPVGACAVVAGGMLWSQDPRLVAIEVALPGAVLVVGAALSALPLGLLLGRRARRRARRIVEEAAREAAGAAAAAERDKHQRFLARLDHELKNPLTAIRATSVAAQSTPPRDGEDRGREYAQNASWRIVDDQAGKLSAVVRDLRKLAELETRPLDFEVIALDELLHEAIDALAAQNPDAGARTQLSVTRVPWPVPPLRADLDVLSLAIDNVLANAAKYSSHGPIEVRLREQEGWAVIEVADAGRGIPATELPSVFDELSRAHNARDVSGSGIGLTLVATVMRRHGGDVSIRSIEGSGTVVALRLPIRS